MNTAVGYGQRVKTGSILFMFHWSSGITDFHTRAKQSLSNRVKSRFERLFRLIKTVWPLSGYWRHKSNNKSVDSQPYQAVSYPLVSSRTSGICRYRRYLRPTSASKSRSIEYADSEGAACNSPFSGKHNICRSFLCR